jgi:hypothetical protein
VVIVGVAVSPSWLSRVDRAMSAQPWSRAGGMVSES